MLYGINLYVELIEYGQVRRPRSVLVQSLECRRVVGKPIVDKVLGKVRRPSSVSVRLLEYGRFAV